MDNKADLYKVTMNENTQRFEVQTGSEVAFIDYRWYQDKLNLLYVFVPVPYRGKGISEILIKHALEFATHKKVKVSVYCPYIAKYIRLHPEYQHLLD